MTDTELSKLCDYMKILAMVDDVREVIRTSFSANAFSEEFVRHHMCPQNVK
jgi:hypothetical protein